MAGARDLLGWLHGTATGAAAAARRAGRPAGWGGFRRLEPLSRAFGADRGTPLDRYYISAFLAAHATDVRGQVLEVGDPGYTHRYGGARVTASDVLHATPGNPQATLVGDLASGEGIPRDRYDCVILTQVLPVIYDLAGAVRHVHAALHEQGVALATLPALTQGSAYDRARWGDYWRFTSQGAGRLFGEVFGPGCVAVAAHGNLLAATALLHGLAAEELTPEELAHGDADYEVLITVRAVKAGPR